ncbi:MAG TPA: phage tail protein, partial [Ignavibacteriales bacterium]|nr:phage tail protein [Ignavibacteriales bacterium]
NDGVTSPFFVASNVLNTNLNADMVDGVHVSASPTLNTIPKSDSVEGKLVDGWIYGQVPVGGIMMYGGGNTTDPAPSIPDFLYCDGSAISRTTFATLFDKISTTFGTGDGSTTFNIPNFKAVVPRGMGTQTINTRGKDGGNLGALLEDRIQQMTGELKYASQVGSGDVRTGVFASSTFFFLGQVGGTGAFVYDHGIVFNASLVARTGDYTRDNSLSVRFYIRYK